MRTNTDLKLDRDTLTRTLTGARLFRTVDPELVRTFVPHASVHRLKHGEQLWQRGTPAEHVHVVLRGVLELQRTALGSESTLVALFGPGESPAMPVALEQRPYIADSFAATPILEVLRVRARPLLDLLPVNAPLANAFNRALLDHCRLIHAKVDVLAAGTVSRRVAACVLDLTDRFGDEQEDGSYAVPFLLSRQQLATYVCARVETVIRVMSSWQKQGLVLTQRDGFVIPSIKRLRDVLVAHDAPGEPIDAIVLAP
jgi:CRP-like cAMP-binding protein